MKRVIVNLMLGVLYLVLFAFLCFGFLTFFLLVILVNYNRIAELGGGQL